MASNGLLDQNERLKAAIVAEEREKFQSEKVNAAIFRSDFLIREGGKFLERSPYYYCLTVTFKLTPREAQLLP